MAAETKAEAKAYDYALDAVVLHEEPDSDSEPTESARVIAAHNLENPEDLKDGAFGVKLKSDTEIKESGLFTMVESSEGAKWMATKPWKGAIVAPTREPRNIATAPDASLALEWIHGYRGFDARSNLVYNTAGHIVYPIAGVCVVYDQKEHKQRHFMGHNDDVTCLAQHPTNPNIIATGQVATVVNKRATAPKICVWDSSASDFKMVELLNAGQRSIRALGFSSDGKYLASVGDDDKKSVTVWNWASRTKIVTVDGDGTKVFQLKWNPKVPTEFVTVGEKHVYFWSFNGSTLNRTKARMGGKYPWQSFGSVSFSEKGFALCGSFDGSVYVFMAGEAKKCIKISAGKVNSMEWFAGGLIAGGTDCKVSILDKTLTKVKEFALPSKISSVYARGSTLLVGTAGAEIFEIPDFAAAATESKELVPTIRGHCEGENWGLATSADGKTFVSAGEDNRIFKWELAGHRCTGASIIASKRAAMPKVLRASTMSTLPPNQCARAVAIHPRQTDVCIGTNDGLVHVFDFATMTERKIVDLNPHGKRAVTAQKGNWIQVMQYNPAGTLLAVGTHGSVICLLDPARDYAVRGVLDKHNSFVTHIDWSADGNFMQSNDGAYELLFWSIDEKSPSASRQATGVSALRDTVWATQTCILGWSVQGIFDPSQDGTDVNTVDTSPSKTLIATGDDYGDINLFRYPALEGNAKKSYIGHSSHVVTTRFTPDERYLVSAGGNDKGIFVWRVVRPAA